MITGAAASAGMIVTAGVIIARYFDLTNAADVLGSAATVTMPVLAVGVALLLLGRWIYGSWDERSPIVHAVAYGIRSAGLVVALVLGAMLLFLVVTGIKAEDATIAIVLGAGTAAGGGLVILGMRIRSGSGRSYLD
jgi:hypothetical protein